MTSSSSAQSARWPVYLVIGLFILVTIIFMGALVLTTENELVVAPTAVTQLTADTYMDKVNILLQDADASHGALLVEQVGCTACHREGAANNIAPSYAEIAARAAQKYLEQLNDPRFKVTASSPMSGAYDMTGEQEKYMFQEYPRPFYLPYLLVSYQEAYHLLDIDNIYKIFKSPFDTLLPKYYTNNFDKTLDDLDKIMPKVPKDVVIDSLVEIYKTDPNFKFTIKLRENN